MVSALSCTPVWTTLLALTLANSASGDAWVERMLPEKEHDFGTVEKGAEAVYRFPVKNPYKHEIELVRVRTSCGCTEARLETTKLLPGQIGKLATRLNTTSFIGPHEATLTLEAAWDDHGVRRRGEASVRVEGKIRSGVVIEPETVTFCNVRLGTTHEQRVRISSDGKKSWNVKNVACNYSNLEVDLTETSRNADRVVYEMIVRLKETAPLGFFREQLILVTDQANTSEIPLDVSGQVVPAISVAPEVLFLKNVAGADEVVRKVVVRGERPFQVIAIQLNGKDVEFRLKENQPSRRHVVELIFRPTDRQHPTRALRITTRSADDADATATAQAAVVLSDASPSGFN